MYPFFDQLAVTEAEPLLAYIWSMNRFQSVAQDTDQEVLLSIMQKAKAVLEKRLENSPVIVMKATELFEAY